MQRERLAARTLKEAVVAEEEGEVSKLDTNVEQNHPCQCTGKDKLTTSVLIFLYQSRPQHIIIMR